MTRACPGPDGLAVIECLRNNPATERIPVMLMSGYNVARFDVMDANGFLQKPFTMSELLASVRCLLTEDQPRLLVRTAKPWNVT